MKQDNVIDFHKPGQIEDPFPVMLRTGANRLIHQAVETEFDALL